MKGKSDYFKAWYEKNRANLAERRAQKYKSDTAYRRRAQGSNRKYYDKIKASGKEHLPVATVGKDTYYAMSSVAAIVGRSPNTVRNLVKSLGIPTVRFGKYVTISSNNLEKIKELCPRK